MAEFLVLGRERAQLGVVALQPAEQSCSFLWPKARDVAGLSWNVPPASVTVEKLELLDGRRLVPGQVPEPDLAAGGTVFVSAPVGTPQLLERRVISLEGQMATMQEQMTSMKSSMLRNNFRVLRIALRALLDAVRKRALKVPLTRKLSSKQKLAWNNWIETAEAKTLGLTTAQLDMTKYKAYKSRRSSSSSTLQDQGNDAAHDVSIEEIAEAVAEVSMENAEICFPWSPPNLKHGRYE
jgi:hypothetical protein